MEMNSYIMALLSKMPELKTAVTMDYAEFKQKQIKERNLESGDLLYYDCNICHNKGVIFYLDEELEEHAKECECMKKRAVFERLNKSGLGDVITTQTFSTFSVVQDFQKIMKDTAVDYVKANSKNWFYIGGQSGCGKTHICTAIAVNLISNGKNVKYEMWRSLFHYLQANQFNFDKYDNKIKEIQSVDILYIDDFLKSFNKENPNELNFAFEVIQARYVSGKPTIISSELYPDDLKKIDSAIAGRIIEKSGQYIVNVSKSDSKNYRLR